MKYSQSDVEKLRRDFSFTLKPWVESSSLGKASEGNGWQSMIMGADFEMFNSVWISGLGAECLDAALADLEERNIAGHIQLSGAGLTHSKVMADRGYTIGSASAFMAWHPDETTESFTLREGLEVSLVTNVAELESMLSVFQSTFHVDDAGMVYFRELFNNWNIPHLLWLLHDKGQLVSIVTSVVFENSVGIYSMATPESAQKKGYGAELLQYVQQHHVRAGQDTALLFATPAGKFLYDKLGWNTLEYTQFYSRNPSSLLN